MNLFGKAVAVTLVATFLGPSLALTADTSSAIGSADLDRALLQRVGEDEQAREILRGLLARPRNRAPRRRSRHRSQAADSALATLDGEELRDLPRRAQLVDGELAGGKTVTISLVAALLNIIIPILLAD